MIKRIIILFLALLFYPFSWANSGLLPSGPQIYIDFNRTFDFKTCEENHLLSLEFLNGPSPFSEEKTKKIRALSVKCHDDIAHSYLSNFLSSGLNTKIDILDKSSLQEIYADLRKNPYFPYEIIETQNCFQRVKLISLYLIYRGILPQQIIVRGDLNVASPLTQNKVHWDTHTSVVVNALWRGRQEKIIIDPSLSNRPIKIAEWANLMKNSEPKRPLQIEFIPNFVATSMHKQSLKDRTQTLGQIAHGMIRDLFYIFDEFEQLPERFIIDEDILRITEYARFHMRKNLKYNHLKMEYKK